MHSPRRSLLGSYHYSVVIKPDNTTYSDSMSGNLELYDGKHIIETIKFTSFSQLVTAIMNYWEKKLGTDVNVHRFSNWLSEYFSDIGITNINFYEMLETVKGLGKGVSLKSSGFEIREAKVIPEYLGDKDVDTAKPAELKPAGTYVDFRGEAMEAVPEKLRPEEPPSDTVLKPSEIFKKEETVSPIITHIPIQKEEEPAKPKPPTNTLLKPSEVLKERDSVVFIDEEPTVKPQVLGIGDPVITKPIEKSEKKKPPSDHLLKPSEYLKEREIIDSIFDITTEPRTFPEEKKTEIVERTLKPPSEKLLKPGDYLREMEIEEKEDIKAEPKEQKEIEKPLPIRSTTLPHPSKIDPTLQKIPAPPISEKPITDFDTVESQEKKKEGEVIDFGIEVKKESEPLAVTFRKITSIDDLRITDIMGVGEKIALLLEKGGFDKIQQIMETTPEELSKIPGIGITSAKQLIYGAKALMKKGLEILAAQQKGKKVGVTDIIGVGNKTAMILKEGGYDSVDDIVNSKPEELSKIPGIGLAVAEKLITGAKELLEKRKEEC